MEITEVKVFPVRDRDKSKNPRAFVSIVLDGSFMVNDIKVIQGKDGFFISMPSRRKKNGRFKDIAHPLNQETRQAMEDRIVAEYLRMVESGDEARSQAEARPEAAPLPAEPAVTNPPADKDEGQGATADDKSLEEVAEAHLSDSYWTT